MFRGVNEYTSWLFSLSGEILLTRYRQTVIQWFCLGAWLILNMLCSYFNRILFHHLGFHFPVLLTLSHGITTAAYYIIVTMVIPWIIRTYMLSSSRCYTNGARWLLSKLPSFERISINTFVRSIAPVALVTCLSTILTNQGLGMMDVAALNFAKSSTPIFTALLGLLVLGKREPPLMYVLFVIMMLGVALAVRDDLREVNVTMLGLVVVTLSAITRALANILSEYLLTRSEPSMANKQSSTESALTNQKSRIHPLAIVFYSNPIEVLILGPLFLLVEWKEFDSRNKSTLHPLTIAALIWMDTIAVFLLRAVTLYTIKHTSGLAITIFAQVKFAAAILISNLWFDYSFSLNKFIGALLVMGATFGYSYFKQQNNTAAKYEQSQTSERIMQDYNDYEILINPGALARKKSYFV